VVSEPTAASARAAGRICALSEGLPVAVRRKVLVWNKTGPSGVPEAAQQVLAGRTFDETVILPADEEVEQLSATEQSALKAAMPEPFTRLLDACIIV